MRTPFRTRHAPLALLLWGALMLMTGCQSRSHENPGTSSGEMPDQEVTDFVLSETDQGRVEWKLYARSAATFQARNTVVAQSVRVDFYDQEGKRSSTLTAREGELNQVQRDMKARGNVLLQTAEGTRMSTDHLQFINKTQRITTDAFVRVEQPGGNVLTGYGFESDAELRHFEFKRKVNAVVRTRSEELLDHEGGK